MYTNVKIFKTGFTGSTEFLITWVVKHPIKHSYHIDPAFTGFVFGDFNAPESKPATQMKYEVLPDGFYKHKVVIPDSITNFESPEKVKHLLVASYAEALRKDGYAEDIVAAATQSLENAITPAFYNEEKINPYEKFGQKVQSNYHSNYSNGTSLTIDELKAHLTKIKATQYQYSIGDSGEFHLGGSNENHYSHQSQKLPGMNAKINYPCGCGGTSIVWSMVQHLNDHHKWTREQIADWLDELHDKGIINIEFEVETISDEEIQELTSSGGGE